MSKDWYNSTLHVGYMWWFPPMIVIVVLQAWWSRGSLKNFFDRESQNLAPVHISMSACWSHPPCYQPLQCCLHWSSLGARVWNINCRVNLCAVCFQWYIDGCTICWEKPHCGIFRLYMGYLELHFLLWFRTGNYTPTSLQLLHQYYLSPLEISSLVCYLTWLTFRTLEVLYQGSFLDLYFYPVLNSENLCKEKGASWTIIVKVLSSRGWGKSIEVSVFFSLYLCLLDVL